MRSESNPGQALGAGLQRRGFLGRLGLGVLAAGMASGIRFTEAAAEEVTSVDERDAWLHELKGKHRQIFDATSLAGGKPFNPVRNYLDTYRDAYGIPDAEMNAIVGVHGSAAPIVFDDETWRRFSFGEQFGIDDPRGGAALRNVYFRDGDGSAAPAGASVESLMARGVIFLLCNNSLRRVTGTLSQAGHGTTEEVRAALISGLIPGVHLVPGVMVAVNRAQERGVSYVYAG